MAAAAKRIFFGWWVVLASIVGLALGYSAIGVFTFGTFVKPLEAEFGWSRAQVSAGLTVATLTSVVMSPLAGYLVDRLGVRRVLLPSIVLLSITLTLPYLMTGSLWQFYLIYLLLPILGGGTTPLAYSRVLINWFDRKRGLALGLGLAGVGVGAALMPALAQWIIDQHGWRYAYLTLAAIILLVSLPVIAALLQESPTAMGLRPDGALPRATESDGPTGLSAREAARTRTYWLMLLSFVLVGSAMTGLIAHLVPMLIGRGADPAQAALTASSLGISLLVGRVVAGHLMDRFFTPKVVIVFLLGPVTGLALFGMGTTGGLAVLSTVLMGLAIGAEFDVIAYFASRYFGLRAFGQIYGFMYGAFMLGSATGPLFLGLVYDRLGRYHEGMWLLSAVTLLSCLLIGLLEPYPRRTD